MRKFFNGGSGLGTTYWVGVFAVGVLAKFVFRFINWGYLTIQDDAKYAQLELFHNIFLVALCIYMLLMVRAMIKAGFNDRRPGGWGWVGIVLTITSTLYLLYVSMTVLFPSTATPRFMLELELRNLNKQLPQDMGDGLVMTRTAIEGDELVYFISVEGRLDAAGRKEMQFSLLDTLEGQAVCQDLQGYFTGGISGLIYAYAFENDTIRQEINGTDCLAWLETQ